MLIEVETQYIRDMIYLNTSNVNVNHVTTFVN